MGQSVLSPAKIVIFTGERSKILHFICYFCRNGLFMKRILILLAALVAFLQRAGLLFTVLRCLDFFFLFLFELLKLL